MFGERSPWAQDSVNYGDFMLQRKYNKLLEQYRILEADRDVLYVQGKAMQSMIRDHLIRSEDDRPKVNAEYQSRIEYFKKQARG